MDGYHSYNDSEYVDDIKQDGLKEIYEVFVNDARRELNKPELSLEDLNRKNTEFVYCAVDGILLTFLVTLRDIKVDEQLFLYYGPTYG